MGANRLRILCKQMGVWTEINVRKYTQPIYDAFTKCYVSFWFVGLCTFDPFLLLNSC